MMFVIYDVVGGLPLFFGEQGPTWQRDQAQRFPSVRAALAWCVAQGLLEQVFAASCGFAVMPENSTAGY